MAQQVKIDIDPTPQPLSNKTAVFNPQKIVVTAGDLIFWRNNDTRYTHQPKPVNGATNAWVTTPISVKLDDQAGTSNTLSFNSGTTISGVPYVCAQHSGETGTIIAVNNININNLPGAQPGAAQAAFAPKKQTLGVNEAFVWSNNDGTAHWPAPSTSQQNAWFQAPIQPGQKSPVFYLTQSNPNLTYVCALHPNETGTIVVQ
ncbi:MAG TPA: hypothetical protein VE262_17780 [Blastocatellia bacterium]|nr:hypothetical protein [Blastocatellia bacterium]